MSASKASHWNKWMGAQSVRANLSISSVLQLNHKPSLSRAPETLCTTHTAPAEAFHFMLTDRCNSPDPPVLCPFWKNILALFLLHFLSAGRKLQLINDKTLPSHFKVVAQQLRSASEYTLPYSCSSPDCWTVWFLVGWSSARRNGYGRTKILHPEEGHAKHCSDIIPQIKPKTLESWQEREWLVMQGFSCEQ